MGTGTLFRYREMSCYKLYAYCLMDNHIHILLQEQSEPIGAAMKRISSSYVLWFNMFSGIAVESLKLFNKFSREKKPKNVRGWLKQRTCPHVSLVCG